MLFYRAEGTFNRKRYSFPGFYGRYGCDGGKCRGDGGGNDRRACGKSPYNIDEAKVLVTGYGYCGKAIAKRLGALGARVTVLARRKEARKEAKGDGFYAVDFAFGPEEAMGAAMVVNTVPALVVTEKIIRELPRDAYIVDIASGEGGTDFACAREYGIHADHVLGIPGKYAPKESAYILERSVERFILKEKQGEMSDGF